MGSGCLKVTKYFLFLFNLLFLILGAVILGFGIWILADKTSFIAVLQGASNNFSARWVWFPIATTSRIADSVTSVRCCRRVACTLRTNSNGIHSPVPNYIDPVKGFISRVLLNTLAWLWKVLGGGNTPTNAVHTDAAASSICCAVASGWLLQYYKGRKHNKRCWLVKWGHEQKRSLSIGSQKGAYQGLAICHMSHGLRCVWYQWASSRSPRLMGVTATFHGTKSLSLALLLPILTRISANRAFKDLASFLEISSISFSPCPLPSFPMPCPLFPSALVTQASGREPSAAGHSGCCQRTLLYLLGPLPSAGENME
ncbi:CD82 antigen isoform 1-T2 [Alca torda]